MARARLTRLGFLLMLLLALQGCAPSKALLRQAEQRVVAEQNHAINCQRADRCATPSLLRDQIAQSAAAAEDGQLLHFVDSLDHGEDSLLLRLHLIRSAQRSIALQSYVVAEDEAGYLLLHELLQAARRGVRVRMLVDQLFSVDNPGLLARLALEHSQFELRMYNPTFNKAHTSKLEFAGGILCCLPTFHQRMHSKLLLVDGEVAISGGRNYQNRYFDWDPLFNYLDRDVLVIGPVIAEMERAFELYWDYRDTVTAAALTDVARYLVDPSDHAGDMLVLSRARHIGEMVSVLENWQALSARLNRAPMPVQEVEFYYDLPGKRGARASSAGHTDITSTIRELVTSAERELLIQTPYLVLSSEARRSFRRLRRNRPDLQIRVATNSLASTDHYVVYAITQKYRRRFIFDLGFNIHELMPYPAVAPLRVAGYQRLSQEAIALGQKTGTRVGAHAKTIVIDNEVVLIGSHNFDPRSDNINSESGVLIRDRAFAEHVAAIIEQDMAPDSAWVINHREEIPILSCFSRAAARVSESLPLFDLWPYRYTTSYQLREGFDPVGREDPRFFEHYKAVGDYPGVPSAARPFKVWFISAFGDFAVPIL